MLQISGDDLEVVLGLSGIPQGSYVCLWPRCYLSNRFCLEPAA